MLYPHNLVLGVPLCVDLGVEYLEHIRGREGASARSVIPNESFPLCLDFIEDGLCPILDKVRVCIAEFAYELKLLEILEKHEVLPLFIVTEFLQLDSIQLETATIDG